MFDTYHIQEHQAEFEIEKIISHRLVGMGTYIYKVRWLGYGLRDETRQEEGSFTSAQDILKSYKNREQLGQPKISKRYASTTGHNKLIWQSAERTIATIKGYLTREQRSSRQIEMLYKCDEFDIDEKQVDAITD